MSEAKPQRITRTIEKEVEIAAPVDAVWKALTDGEELSRWFPLKAKVQPGSNGSVFLSWGPGMEATEPITVWEPKRHLQIQSSGPNAPDDESKSAPAEQTPTNLLVQDWYLEPRGGKTLLRLVHSGFVTGSAWDDEWYESHDYGWTFMLANLRHYLAQHRGTPRQVVWHRAEVKMEREAAYRRFVACGGFFQDHTAENWSAGQRYFTYTSTGEAISGVVEFVQPPRGFCVSVDELNGALLWFSVEGSGARHEVQLWLSAYGVPQDRLDALGKRWGNFMKEFAEAESRKAEPGDVEP
jgi:uncharacterized protein YndB with AHSA1/START domain